MKKVGRRSTDAVCYIFGSGGRYRDETAYPTPNDTNTPQQRCPPKMPLLTLNSYMPVNMAGLILRSALARVKAIPVNVPRVRGEGETLLTVRCVAVKTMQMAGANISQIA